MLLQWTERDEWGNETIKTHPSLSVDDATSYAKNTCQQCWSKGYNCWDDGWNYYTVKEKDHYYIDRKPINPRIYTCSCVDRHIERYGL